MLECELPSRKAFRIALIYALVAALWIAATDYLTGLLAFLPGLITTVSLIKGWVFVAVTAILLFWLLRRDYEELQQAAAAAGKNETLLKEVLEDLPVGVWLLDKRGQIVHGNREGTRIWGGVRYVGIEDFGLHKGWWAASGQPIAPREWGAARAILDGESSFNEEIEIEGFDQERRVILHSSVPLFDAQGTITGAVVVNQDITAMKAAQAARERAEEFLSRLLDNAPAPIYVNTPDGRFRLVNKAWCEIVGMEPEQVSGLRIDQVFPSDIALQFLENNRRILENQTAMMMEEYVDRAEGRRFFQSIKFPVSDPGEGTLAVAGISLDITERKQLEEQLKAYHAQLQSLASDLTLAEERERRRIATGLHDEIAQPLALARIRLGELAAGTPSEDCRQMAGGVRKLVEEAIRQVRTFIFDLSPPLLYEIGLGPALRSLAERFASQHGLAVDVRDEGGGKLLPEEQQVLLYQATRELLANVIKHAQARRAKITLGRAEDSVQVTVEDDGVGFEAGPGQGTGFGHFSIRERVRHMGGHMEIDTAPGRGTRVVLTVPAAASSEEGTPP